MELTVLTDATLVESFSMETVSVLTIHNGTHLVVFLVPVVRSGIPCPGTVHVLLMLSGMEIYVSLVMVEEHTILLPGNVFAHLDQTGMD